MSDTVHKVSVDAAGLRNLLEHAKLAGTMARWAELAMEYVDAAEAEVLRLKRGEFTKEEVQEFCHKLPETCSAQEFADGCARYQRFLFGEAPDADLARIHRIAAESPRKNRQHETMTNFFFQTCDAAETNYYIRVWCTSKEGEVGPDAQVVQTLSELQGRTATSSVSRKDIANALDGFLHVAAYEIIDRYGHGAIVYPDWK